MRRTVIAAACLATIAGLVFVAQRLDVQVDLRANEAAARDEATRAFWSDGGGSGITPQGSSFADLAETLSPAVVSVNVQRRSTRAPRRPGGPGGPEMFEEFFGQRRRAVPSSGSGFVITSDGYIVSNDHVVGEAEEIRVGFKDGTQLDAQLVGRDPETDLALIKVEPEEPLQVAPLGDSDSIRVGDWVMAIGNPFGFAHSVTVGILSARGRDLNSGRYDDFLQTDASINPGNSGGPLIDMKGNVVGINTAIRVAQRSTSHLGFAIPINMVKDLLPQLREDGKVTRGWLGVSIQRVTPKLAESFELERPHGALVSQVFEESPAASAKLRAGDIIVSFDGHPIDDFHDLPRRVAITRPGSKVAIVVIRDGDRKTLKATLERMEQDEQVVPALGSSPRSEWGFAVEDITSETAERLNLDEDAEGAVISSVSPDSPAGEAGLRNGDLIMQLNRKRARSAEGVAKLLADAEGEPVLLLLIRRGEGTLFLTLEKDDG